MTKPTRRRHTVRPRRKRRDERRGRDGIEPTRAADLTAPPCRPPNGRQPEESPKPKPRTERTEEQAGTINRPQEGTAPIDTAQEPPARTPRNAETHSAWVERETRRRLAEEIPNAPRDLLPLDQFPTMSVFAEILQDRAQKRTPGEPCEALEGLIAGSCNGWVKRPTAREMEQAVKTRQSTRRARCIVRVVLSEADTMCIAHADAAGAFSLQDLAWWINETKLPCYRRIKWLNAMGRAWWLRKQRNARRTDSQDDR